MNNNPFDVLKTLVILLFISAIGSWALLNFWNIVKEGDFSRGVLFVVGILIIFFLLKGAISFAHDVLGTIEN